MTPTGLPTVSLRRLFPNASFVACGDIRVAAAFDDSRACLENSLFAVIPGHQAHGAHYISDAIRRGATALLVEQPVVDVGVPQCVVKNVRRAYARLAAALHGDPARSLGLVGVTGTNGKTTVTWLVRHLLRQQGLPAGLLGTIEYSDGFTHQPSTLTTPRPAELAQWLAGMVANGCPYGTLELSSHALAQDRAVAAELDVAIVTNITADHLDYHESPAAYRAAKARIFSLLKRGGRAVINADDPGARSLLAEVPPGVPVVTYGIDQPADIMATMLEESILGSRFAVTCLDRRVEFATSLIGRHNIGNCLAAIAAANHFGITPVETAAGLRSFHEVPGRLERIDEAQPFDVFVDYAHTPDALERSLGTLRRLTRGRLLCVFGAGGDRDRSKRPLMGNIAGMADIAIVTSDNPRSENPEAIIAEILSGARSPSARYHAEVDRRVAIGWAVAQARPGDCLLIAGKGHEQEQVIGTDRFPFDDRAVVRSFLSGNLPYKSDVTPEGRGDRRSRASARVSP